MGHTSAFSVCSKNLIHRRQPEAGGRLGKNASRKKNAAAGFFQPAGKNPALPLGEGARRAEDWDGADQSDLFRGSSASFGRRMQQVFAYTMSIHSCPHSSSVSEADSFPPGEARALPRRGGETALHTHGPGKKYRICGNASPSTIIGT